jgi:phosphatidylserine synthase
MNLNMIDYDEIGGQPIDRLLDFVLFNIIPLTIIQQYFDISQNIVV